MSESEKNIELGLLQNVTHVRIIKYIAYSKWGHPVAGAYNQESEVNEALSLGWKLASLQHGDENPIFVMIWDKSDNPQRTEYEKKPKEKGVFDGFTGKFDDVSKLRDPLAKDEEVAE